ncbi:hypothetical protein [Variovorax sp. dw_308]|uniref:hypothetical protein n=1 Tax=Variovorax sp. dw_308 TaxID=2721546 RepID=UPI001C496CA1|nr:hypothetical protein [Variovorax sp. dw_308]
MTPQVMRDSTPVGVRSRQRRKLSAMISKLPLSFPFPFPSPATRRMFASRLALAAAALGCAASGWARGPAAPPVAPTIEFIYEGALGTDAIGMTLAPVKGAEGQLTGHYFLGKALADIPLTGSQQNGRLLLLEAGGGVFDLELVGAGNGDGKPPELANSIGATGTWTLAKRRLDVTLGNTGKRESSARRYEKVTSEPDAAFEARVQDFYKAVLASERAEAARFVDYPLKVKQGGKTRQIASTEQLVAAWDQVFTKPFIEALKVALPHDMSVANGQAMMGSGVIWFGAKGAAVINLP